jgi:hypothetical protein
MIYQLKKLVTYQKSLYSVLCMYDGRVHQFSKSVITQFFSEAEYREFVINKILKMRVICNNNDPHSYQVDISTEDNKVIH